ncbi:hypothetical protein Q8G28_00030 [Lysinibacillus capsici]|uniref:hypothetical protein n=1 Tax=Lysinibacillus capsici TaxID=2115968 RepID=UPI002730171D|nr:hypothetical protein [Lysinibacillus capsici]MDP1392770.1 hypothetical protein [Lysinibacillus capsici]MDP1413245.1 hypothetical protein [Lysinibacillus capsici]MDP1428121.1 hypothetical protein [Lysinibacillus capsici]
MNILEINNDLFRMLNSLGKEFQFFNLPMIIIAEYTVIFLAIFVILFWFTKDRENKIMLMCASIAFVLAELTLIENGITKYESIEKVIRRKFHKTNLM